MCTTLTYVYEEVGHSFVFVIKWAIIIYHIFIHNPIFGVLSTFSIILKRSAVRPDSHDVPDGHVIRGLSSFTTQVLYQLR